jgi:hypothetical protein
MLRQMIGNMPSWVWGLLGLLITMGILASREHDAVSQPERHAT